MRMRTSLTSFRLQGKSSKELKEAFIELRASFQYVTKQLENLKKSKEQLSKDYTLSKRYNARYKSRIKTLQDDSANKLKTLESSHKDELKSLNKEITDLQKSLVDLESKLESSRTRSTYHSKVKYYRSVRIKELRDVIKDKNRQIANLVARVERLKNKPKPKTKVKVVKEKVYETKIVKEPLPDKVRQILTENTLTKSKMDALAVATSLLRFSDITKLTLRQQCLLLEANNLKYFTYKQLMTKSQFTLKELEDKGLISGDRGNTKRAIGWFITKKGIRVAEMLHKKMINVNQIKREYLFQNEDR